MTKTHQSEPSGSSKIRLPTRVRLLGWVSFFADVSGEMAYPLLPLFVTGVLKAPAAALGTIEGLAEAIVALMKGVSGWHSDTTGRRVPWVRAGYALPVVGKTLVAAATAWPMVLAGRLTDRLGKGLRTSPRDALIADSVPESIRGRAFGFHRAVDTAGAFTGVILSAGLLWWLGAFDGRAVDHDSFQWPVRTVLFIAAGLGLFAVALTLLLSEPTPGDRSPSTASQPAAPGAPIPRLSSGYWRTLTILMVFALANSSDAFILLRAADVGLAPWAVVLAYALFNLTYTLGAYPAGILSDSIGRWRVMTAGWVIYALVYAGLAVADHLTIWPLMAAYGLYMALTDGVAKALIVDHAPPQRKGTALGVYYACTGMAALLASLGAGVLWDRAGPAAPFVAGALLAAIATLLVLALAPRPSNGSRVP